MTIYVRFYIYYPQGNIRYAPSVFSESAGHFKWPAEFKNVSNSNFKNLKHLQNPGHLFLNATSIAYACMNVIAKTIRSGQGPVPKWENLFTHNMLNIGKTPKVVPSTVLS